MNSFSFNDALSFKMATQTEDTNAKVQVFVGVFVGVVLRWIYSIAVEVIKTKMPWDFGTLPVILARVVIALITTFFVFSGYWQKAKDVPASWRFWNALAYGISIDAMVGPWMG
jgi:fluoride ion exporter CrcB/FEX